MAIDEKTVKQEIETGQNISVNIRRLASTGKESVKYILHEILKKHNAVEHTDDIFVTVTELVFNAIKANYKYIFLLDTLEEHLQKSKAPHNIRQVMANKTLYNGYLKNINIQEINEKVKFTFKNEEEAGKLIYKAEAEGRTLAEDEKADVEKKLVMMKRAKELGIKVYMNFNFEQENVIIDIVNDSPISEEDLQRIEEKRQSFRKYYNEGREHEFYVENLDTAESAGLGIAMIDARLYRLNIDPLNHFNIFGIGNKTCLTLTYPIH